MDEYEAYAFALKIFEEQEQRKPKVTALVISDDEVAVSCIHVGIVETLKHFNLLK